MGAVGKVSIDPDGRHIWAIVRCDRLEDPSRFGDECRDSKTDPITKFSPEGKVVKSFGGGMFIWPHGLDVDGNVWVSDAVADNRTPKGDKRGQGRQVQSRGKGVDDAGRARAVWERPPQAMSWWLPTRTSFSVLAPYGIPKR